MHLQLAAAFGLSLALPVALWLAPVTQGLPPVAQVRATETDVTAVGCAAPPHSVHKVSGCAAPALLVIIMASARRRAPAPSGRTKRFSCHQCGFNSFFDLQGHGQGKFPGVVFLEPAYMIFEGPRSVCAPLCIGGDCVACDRMVCLDCSLFYKQRHCFVCVARAEANQAAEPPAPEPALKEYRQWAAEHAGELSAMLELGVDPERGRGEEEAAWRQRALESIQAPPAGVGKRRRKAADDAAAGGAEVRTVAE
jgi:hypothetical protein